MNNNNNNNSNSPKKINKIIEWLFNGYNEIVTTITIEILPIYFYRLCS